MGTFVATQNGIIILTYGWSWHVLTNYNSYSASLFEACTSPSLEHLDQRWRNPLTWPKWNRPIEKYYPLDSLVRLWIWLDVENNWMEEAVKWSNIQFFLLIWPLGPAHHPVSDTKSSQYRVISSWFDLIVFKTPSWCPPKPCESKSPWHLF